MTPIQQHETELRAMMERAGLAPKESSDRYLDGHSETATVSVHLYRGGTIAFTVDAPYHSAEHPDPRIALRHCLEMAGLLVDRPPATDAELVAWLVERWGDPETHRHTDDGKPPTLTGAMVWPGQGVSCDCIRPDGRRWYYAGSLLTARELGAILWCGERWPEVQP